MLGKARIFPRIPILPLKSPDLIPREFKLSLAEGDATLRQCSTCKCRYVSWWLVLLTFIHFVVFNIYNGLESVLRWPFVRSQLDCHPRILASCTWFLGSGGDWQSRNFSSKLSVGANACLLVCLAFDRKCQWRASNDFKRV